MRNPIPLAPLTAVSLGLLLAAPPCAARTAGASPPAPGRAILGSHPMCGVELGVTDNARFSTGFEPEPTWEFQITAGLWVGALVDRGAGQETLVSSAYFQFEFFSEENPPPLRPTSEDVRVDGIRAVMRDTFTPDWLPDHEPLGLEIVQDSHVTHTVGDVSWIDVKYTITNISAELDGTGWGMENVYLGMLADPDVGTSGQGLFPWEDDLGGFAPGPRWPDAHVAPGAVRGDLAYMFDAPGQGDDTDIQVGMVLRNAAVHRFAIWKSPQDPTSDVARYALMRGISDDVPTLDPPPAQPGDHRILIAARRRARLEPGETIGFAISFACGDLVSPSDAPAAPQVARAPDLVVPRGAPGVRLPTDRPVEIWSVDGRRVATVLAGDSWDLNVAGVRAAAGVYFYRPSDRSAPPARIVVLR